MGIDYEARAGYGVKINGNLTEHGVKLLSKYGGNIEEFLDVELPELNYSYIGCCYSETDEVIIDIEDPMEYEGKYVEFLAELLKYSHLFKDIKPKWFCDLYIY